jgi:hypothetical protein
MNSFDIDSVHGRFGLAKNAKDLLGF